MSTGQGQHPLVPPRVSAACHQQQWCDARLQLWQRGWRYYRQGWMTEAVLLLLLTHQYHSCQQDFQEFPDYWKIVEIVLCFFQICCISPWRKMGLWWQYSTKECHTASGEREFDVIWNILFRLMAKVQLYQIQQQSFFFFHCTLDSSNSKEVQLQLLQSLNRSLINGKPLALDIAPCLIWALLQLPVVLLMCPLRGHKAAYLCESGWDSKMQGLLHFNSLECLIL